MFKFVEDFIFKITNEQKNKNMIIKRIVLMLIKKEFVFNFCLLRLIILA